MLLQKAGYCVSDRGELVVLEIGSFRVTLEFQVALEVSAMLRREARIVKVAAGHDFHRRNVMGVLRDASAKVRASRWNRELPARLARRQIRVEADALLVNLTIGKATASLPYPDAQKIAQALRVHGKLARNAAGERAHWAQLAGAA